jgi:hypothetical protein
MIASAPDHPSRQNRALRTFAWLPPLVILLLIGRLGVNVPYQDDWDAFGAVAGWYGGANSFDDFWQQHSEHRIPAVKLLIWLIGVPTRYNMVSEMIVGFALAFGTFIVLRRLIAEAFGDSTGVSDRMVFLASLLLFSLTMRENWFWGLASLQLFLLNLMTLVLVLALTRSPTAGVLLAGTCAVVGSFTEASGLALWITGAAALWWRGRRRALFFWCAAAAIVLAADVWTLDWGLSFQSAGTRVGHMFAFAATCLGLPFAYGTSPAWSAAAGVGAVVALVGAVRYLHARSDVTPDLSPMLLLALHGVLVSLMIAVGRAGLDLEYAMASHYAFASSLFWIATLVIVVRAVRLSMSISLLTARITAAAAVVIPVLSVGYAYGALQGYREAYTLSRNLDMALATLDSADEIPRSVGQLLYPPEDLRLRHQIAELKTLGLGPFAPGARVHLAAASAPDAATTGHEEGTVEHGNCEQLQGWAWDPSRPSARVEVEFWRSGTKLGEETANWFRPDLLEAGIGDGQHAFVFVFPTTLTAGTGERIDVVLAGSGQPLRSSPTTVFCQ